MTELKKVIIPIAGLGTRMLPATKALPKEMLPVASLPIIQRIVKEALDSGFSEIIFITRNKNNLIKDHFETNLELESNLERQKKKFLLKEIKDISKIKSKISSIEQKIPKGLGHAILCAKPLIKGQPFAVMLPDMLLESNYKKTNLALMKKNFQKTGESSILLGKVRKSEVQNYGIAKLKKRRNKSIFFPLTDIVEKPSPQKAPSNLFAAGRYIFQNKILDFLDREKPDATGEIQLSGAISSFLKSSNVLNGLILDGEIHDCGNELGYLIANIAFSLKNPNLKKEILKFIKK